LGLGDLQFKMLHTAHRQDKVFSTNAISILLINSLEYVDLRFGDA